MDNHFKHISADENLKAATLKKAKRVDFRAISSVAAILVVIVGVSVFISGKTKNSGNNAPENPMYSGNYVAEDFDVLIDENKDTEDVSMGLSATSAPVATITPLPATASVAPTEMPVINENPSIKPTATPTLITKAPASTSTLVSDDGLSVQVTERPKGYDEHIAANTYTMYVTEDNVSAHERVSTDALVKFTIPKGAEVIAVRNFQRIWAYVCYEENGINKYGYVLEEYLSTEKQ